VVTLPTPPPAEPQNRRSSAARGLAATALPAALLAALLPAQTGAWSELVPPNGVPVAGVDSIGKLVHFVDGSTLHVWSAFTRRWHQLGIGPNATVRQTNDWLLVQDGPTWTAFAAASGRFAPLALGAGAFVRNPVSQNNDSLLFVRDGTQLHAFSGFIGRWVSRSIAANASTTVQRHTGLLASGNTLSGFSAFSGQWHDQTLTAAVISLSADGTAGLAETPTQVFGFSARRSSWSSSPSMANAVRSRGDDWAGWYDGVQVMAFSGLRGSFTTQPIGPGSLRHAADLYALYATSTSTYGYSAITGSWASTSTGLAAITRTASAVALVEEPLLLTAYSAPLGTFVSTNLDASATSLAGTVIAATERTSGMPALFSALTGNWQAGPADAVPALPLIGRISALLPRAAGFYAFSARTGAFVPLGSASGTAVIGPQTAPAVVWDPTGLHFFDAGRDLWRSEPRGGSGQPTVHLWRTTALVLDGNEALGFGSQSGQIARTAMPEPVAAFRVNSESVTVVTAARALTFSALGQPNTLAQFPDFRRVFTAGGTLYVQLPMQTGDLALIAGGLLATQPMTVAGLGELLLDTQAMAAMLILPRADADRGELLLAVPDLPALHGMHFWFQALLLPATASPVLTTGCEVWIG